MKRIAFIMVLLSGLTCSVASWADSSAVVRIAVVARADEISLTVRSPYKILALHTNQELQKDHVLWNAKVLPTDMGIKINDTDFKIYGIRIQPDRSPTIYLNGRKFRGAIDIIREQDNTLTAINHLTVEEYVRGVLYHEVAPWWPMEALKVQAIISRTFALYQAKINAKKEYDLVSTVYSQVYGGKTSERGRTSRAVGATEGKVLTYKGKVFPSFFHATCAGHTEDASRLWKIDIAPLRGRECGFCAQSPHYSWKARLSLSDIADKLRKAGFEVGVIKEIAIAERDISGRVTNLKIHCDKGVVTVDSNRFRLALGPNDIKSTSFTLELNNDKAYFEGRGWGHGVGLCQWGAFFMSREGFNASQILEYYYPESKIEVIKGEYETF